MLVKKTIKYTDYNNQEREEDFFFEISEAEVVILDANTPEGFLEHMRKVSNNHNGKEIMEMFRMFIRLAYGEKSPDGKYFDKSDEISTRFEHTRAYNVLFMELLTDAKKAAAFVSEVMPFDNDQRKEFNKMVDDLKDQMDKKAADKEEEAELTPIAIDGNEV